MTSDFDKPQKKNGIVLYYIAIVLLIVFDQVPAYPREVFENGGPFTPWSNIPFIRFSSIELLLILCGFCVLIDYKNFVDRINNFKNSGIVLSYLFLLIVGLIGILCGILYNGMITDVYFQARGLVHGISFFAVTLYYSDNDKIRLNIIKVISGSIIVKFVLGSYYLITGGLGLTLQDGTPVVFYDLSSAILMLLIICYLIFSWDFLNDTKKVILSFICLMSFAVFIGSWRRNLYFGMIIAVIWYLIFLFKKDFTIKFLIRSFLYGVIILVVLYIVTPQNRLEQLVERVESSFVLDDSQIETSAGSNMFRFIEFMNVIENVYQRPVFGSGFGGRYAVYYMPSDFIYEVNNVVHNSYLAVLYKCGIVGFMFYLLSLYLPLKTLQKHCRINVKEFVLIKISFIYLIIILVSNLFAPNIFFERFMSIPAVFLALSLNVIEKYETRMIL